MAMNDVRAKGNDVKERLRDSDRAAASEAKIPNPGFESEGNRNRRQFPLLVCILAIEHKPYIAIPGQPCCKPVRVLGEVR
jgi:hypothetical protein